MAPAAVDGVYDRLHLSLPAYPENSGWIGNRELRLSSQTRRGTSETSPERLCLVWKRPNPCRPQMHSQQDQLYDGKLTT
jgi:hypothetical protein